MFVLSLQSYQKGLTPQTGASPIFYFSRLACACIHVHARDEVLADNNNSKSITDNPDATDLFFHGFYCLVGFLCACRALGLSRINSCWRLSSAVKAQIQSVVNPIPSSNTKLNPWKDKIRRIGVIRELFERVRTEPKAKEHVIRYCLPDSSLLLSYNPETSSRVTLASLGIVFQILWFLVVNAMFLTTYNHLRLSSHR